MLYLIFNGLGKGSNELLVCNWCSREVRFFPWGIPKLTRRTLPTIMCQSMDSRRMIICNFCFFASQKLKCYVSPSLVVVCVPIEVTHFAYEKSLNFIRCSARSPLTMRR